MKLCTFVIPLIAVLIGCGAPPPVAPPPEQVLVTPPAPVAALPTTTQVATAPAADGFPTTTDPRNTLPFLASDDLAGRLPGTPGLQRAGDFIASELDRIGVKPVPGQRDYFQNFSMNESTSLAPSTHLTVNGQMLVLEKEYEPMPISAEKEFAGKVVFAGFSITRGANDPSHYDDYADINVDGKVVLAMMKEPLDENNVSRFPGKPWSNSSLFRVKAKTAADHGAVALLLVTPPSSGGPDTVVPNVSDGLPPVAIPVIRISRAIADMLLAKGGAENLKQLQDQINTSFKPHSIDLGDAEITGKVEVSHTGIEVRNVIAVLPATGPHADEWVVVGAHYDHVGRGQLGNAMGGKPGNIWHGADDNASGTCAVLELADKLKHGPPLPRSVLFIFFTGEEEGLLGSNHFVRNPLIPLDKVIAMLNLDMVGRLKNNDVEVGGTATAANWDSVVAAAIAGTGLTTSSPPQEAGGRGGYGPSDHLNFAKHKIPVLFLFTGLHQDYHRPTDTADKINYPGIDTLVGVSQRIVTAMATMQPQKYLDTHDQTDITLMLPDGGHHAVLGVSPNETAANSTTGIPISGVQPGGPAEAAGLKAGDVIVAFNSKPVKTLGDLSRSLDESHGGDKVTINVLRDGKTIELRATLTERK
jgi:hypothetical protein